MTVQLPPLPPRIAALPRDTRGYPIPWFLADQSPEANFQLAAKEKVSRAFAQKRCWICGQHMGVMLCFVVGPISTLTRTSSEPPSHLTCAGFAAVACPFLVRPQMRRMPKAEGAQHPPGDFRTTNPGITALWSTRDVTMVRTTADTSVSARGGNMFLLGVPEAVAWYCEGRGATLAEVSGVVAEEARVLTLAAKREGPRAELDLLQSVQALLPFLPRAEAQVSVATAVT